MLGLCRPHLRPNRQVQQRLTCMLFKISTYNISLWVLLFAYQALISIMFVICYVWLSICVCGAVELQVRPGASHQIAAL